MMAGIFECDSSYVVMANGTAIYANCAGTR
jgi:hypothetical protein